MSLENYEGTALSDYIESQVENNDEIGVEETVPETETDVTETVEPTEGGDVTETEPEEITSVNIPGLGDVSFDEIKEWRNGNMRQSDYTRKTQELARQRENLRDAENMYNQINSNPQLLEALRKVEGGNTPQINSASPESQAIRQLIHDQNALKTDMKLQELERKYGDVDVVRLLQKATELHTDDLEFVWNGIMHEQQSVSNQSADEIYSKAYEKAKADLKAELESDRSKLSTTVSTKQQTAPPKQSELSAEEKRVALNMNLSEAEYLKWRT